MCYWGIALALGPNINVPMPPEAVAPAVAALDRAQALADGVSRREQDYIRALSERYAPQPVEDRSELDRDYADAMGEVAAAHPDDLDAATLYAESLMDLSPWDYWGAGGKPKPATKEILAQLERVLEVNPNHPGACHYYIHAVEAAHPQRAVACADRLAGLMPGAGHIVHMPAHIYIRVGRWDDAISQNQHAVHADEDYIADRGAMGLYPALYYPHNFHFLAFAAMMDGRQQQALAAADALGEKVDVELARKVPELQNMVPYRQLVLTAFERWDEVLDADLPPADLPLAHALAQYARGVASLGKGESEPAREALSAVETAAAATEGEPWQTVARIARHSLSGELALQEGKVEEAVAAFEQAASLEDSLPYMEPPYWYRPVRHRLGVALLERGEAEAAERVYRQDLERFPENGWALKGLSDSLQAQNRTQEADAVARRFREAWQPPQVARAEHSHG
jgi:tetratricopeptide (TPR) repeat protein